MNTSTLPGTGLMRLHGTLAQVLDGQQAALAGALAAWLPTTRWFAGKDRTLTGVRICDCVRLKNAGEHAAMLLLEVQYGDNRYERYALLLAAASPELAVQVKLQAPHAIVAIITGATGEEALVDGLYLPAWPRALLRLIRERAETPGADGSLLGRPGLALDELMAAAGEIPVPAVLAVQQSNTSVAFGQQLLLKQFRRLEGRENPEAEMGRALTEQAHYAAVPPFAGELVYRANDGSEQTLALLQGFIHHQENGWDYATGMVREYLDRITAMAIDEPPPRLHSALPEENEDFPRLQNFFRSAAGDGFTAFLDQLGRRTAELHLALAAIDDDSFKPEPYTHHYQQAMLQASLSRQQHVFRLLRAHREGLPGEASQEAAALLGAEDALRARLIDLATPLPAAEMIRIHGDYHLGQVLYTGRDVVIIDFEGEPGRAASERRLKRSPLRDVAGMLRSFRYAAAAGRRAHPLAAAVGRQRLQPWLDAWSDYAGAVFVRAYCDALGAQTLIPPGAADCRRMLEWFLLDKALYEVAYELGSRPDWVGIPLAGLRELLRLPLVP